MNTQFECHVSPAGSFPPAVPYTQCPAVNTTSLPLLLTELAEHCQPPPRWSLKNTLPLVVAGGLVNEPPHGPTPPANAGRATPVTGLAPPARARAGAAPAMRPAGPEGRACAAAAAAADDTGMASRLCADRILLGVQ